MIEDKRQEHGLAYSVLGLDGGSGEIRYEVFMLLTPGR